MYTLEQLALITGLTTRTLRNYLKSGLLQGTKENGCWRFTEAQTAELPAQPAVRPSIRSRQQGILWDFLADRDQTDGELWVLLHRRMAQQDAKELADRFCRLERVRFSYGYEKGKGRYILSGAERDISRMLAEANGERRICRAK